MRSLRYDKKVGAGKFGCLDKDYSKLVRNSINKCDDNELERWETYGEIIDILISLDKFDYFEEIKYRLTGGENINYIMLSIIQKDFETRKMLESYRETINDFIGIDLISKYCY